MELVSATKVESGKEVEVIEWVNYNQTNKQTNKKKKKIIIIIIIMKREATMNVLCCILCVVYINNRPYSPVNTTHHIYIHIYLYTSLGCVRYSTQLLYIIMWKEDMDMLLILPME